MKTKILETGKEIELPNCFSSKIRQDIAQKVYESEKSYQPFAPFLWAGMNISASGSMKRARKVWKTGYGHGISRIPRKAFWRRGNQFYWRGAIVNSTVGGRRAHPPKVEHFQKELKINKKEREIAMHSGISATTHADYLKKRYPSINKIDIHLPIVIDAGALKLKADKFFEMIEKHIKELKIIAYQKKNKRAGKTKMRLGNKRTAGLLLVTGKDEKFNIAGIEVRKANELKMADLYPLGRFTIYTENAVKELGGKK